MDFPWICGQYLGDVTLDARRAPLIRPLSRKHEKHCAVLRTLAARHAAGCSLANLGAIICLYDSLGNRGPEPSGESHHPLTRMSA
jgi:hypothetical protein